MKRLTCLLLLIVLVPAAVWAAGVGKISGTVTDAGSGDPIPGAAVMVVGSTMGASSSVDGEFFILNVPVGTFDLKITSLGYETLNIQGVEVVADGTYELTATLTQSVIQGKEVTIVAAPDVLKRDHAATIKSLGSTEITELPVTTYRDALATTAGAVGKNENIHVRGGRRDEILYLIDGLPAKDQQFQQRAMDVPTAAIGEVQVLTAGFNAEYGEAQSAVVNLIVKEGDPQYHGRIEHVNDFAGGEHYQDYDYSEGSVSGPEPLTQKLLPRLGVTIPGEAFLFGSGTVWGRNTNLRGTWIDSDRYYRHQVTDLLGMDVRKNQSYVNSVLKLTYVPQPKYKFTFGWNQAQRWENPYWYRLSRSFPDDFSLDEQSLGMHALSGIQPYASDAESFANLFDIDDDADGRVDEEALNWQDDDGDGLVDEDLQYYSYNANDHTRADQTQDQQYYATFNHNLSSKTYYTLRLGGYRTDRTLAGGNKGPNEYGERPEAWVDLPDAEGNGNGRYDIGEPFTDRDGDGLYDSGNPGNQYPDVYGFHIAGDGLGGNYQQLVPDWASFESTTLTWKSDLTSQVNNRHLMKAGLEYSYRNVASEDRPYPTIANDGAGIYTDVYRYYPNSAAFYAQDKMEYRDVIATAGLRMDYFKISGKTLDDRRFDEGEQNYYYYDKPIEGGSAYWSPRLGIAYSVTDRDVFHFNYGYFYQRGRDDYYFTGVNQLQTGGTPILGNPGLKPQKTIAYELGVRHQFATDFLLDIGSYYKDIDNLIQSGSVNRQRQEDGQPVFQGVNFSQYYNIDYGSVRGFEFNVSKSYSANLSGRMTYTLAWANAKNSYDIGSDEARDPNYVRPKKENPVAWDRRHQMVANVGLHYPLKGAPFSADWLRTGWQINVLSQALSGLPYTPTGLTGEEIPDQQFTEHTPWVYTTDLNIARAFRYGGLNWSLLLEVRNVFNALNVVGWDANTFTIDTYLDGKPGYVNDSNSPNYGYSPRSGANPDAWDERRLVRAGLAVEF
ncbi:TonB-dependent receptor [candidate division KSB1 bacterium]|nr:TonB-dependent receptor [candidate division KSB1 bacterium]